ncbi:small integral membrane protein 35 isoform X3 [Strix uralensis]|uniref:small integral membrane protein 35 isoform X3 n=1 Tax=Strix uralensis TaxID=36305 RepID=UPI003DA70B32
MDPRAGQQPINMLGVILGVGLALLILVLFSYAFVRWYQRGQCWRRPDFVFNLYHTRGKTKRNSGHHVSVCGETGEDGAESPSLHSGLQGSRGSCKKEKKNPNPQNTQRRKGWWKWKGRRMPTAGIGSGTASMATGQALRVTHGAYLEWSSATSDVTGGNSNASTDLLLT